MSEKIELNKTVFDKNQYSQLVNTEFSSIGAPQTPQETLEDQPTIDDFFEMYNDLFYDIPEFGDINSHQYLIQKSSEYINFDPNNDEIEALQREIGELRTELLQEQQRNIELTTGVSSTTPTIGVGENTAGPNSGNVSSTPSSNTSNY